MTLQTDFRNTPLPENMRVLLADYPRGSWRAHPNFRQATKNWLGAHRMFRYLAGFIQASTSPQLIKTCRSQKENDMIRTIIQTT